MCTTHAMLQETKIFHETLYLMKLIYCVACHLQMCCSCISSQFFQQIVYNIFPVYTRSCKYIAHDIFNETSFMQYVSTVCALPNCHNCILPHNGILDTHVVSLLTQRAVMWLHVIIWRLNLLRQLLIHLQRQCTWLPVRSVAEY